MEWDLRWGDRQDGLLAVEETTGETPSALLAKPRLHEWLTWVYEAFWLCDQGRPILQGSVGRIPLSEMAAYIELFRIRQTEARQAFIKMMRSLDSVYVKTVNAEIARKVEQERKDAEERAAHGR